MKKKEHERVREREYNGEEQKKNKKSTHRNTHAHTHTLASRNKITKTLFNVHDFCSRRDSIFELRLS